nr:protein suppressor of gene silencing 3 [Tanacetum cinerariifolium]
MSKYDTEKFHTQALNQTMKLDVNLDSKDGWAVFSKKNKNKGGNVAAAASIQAPKPNPWVQPGGRGGAPVRPPTNVWANPAGGRGGAVLSDEYDSDERPKSHEERKKNKWHAEFFITLDKLSVEQINEPDRQWHCPACKNGPGAIDWYKSLSSLMTHARTKGSKRVKIHRDLAELLEEELRIRGALVVPAAGGRGGAVNYNPAPTAIPPPLQTGWNWNSRLNNHPARRAVIGIPQPPAVEEDVVDESDDDDDDDGSDDEVLSDEYDSDERPKSHEERKKSKWHAEFFITLDKLSVEQINGTDRQWHCPACKNGPGAIDWYKSLSSLVTHARTKGSKRVKIHRDLAELLEEELRIRGALVVPAGESYGKWKGLNEVVKDKDIVWPPSVVIMNTKLEQDENDRVCMSLLTSLLCLFRGVWICCLKLIIALCGYNGLLSLLVAR